MAWSIAAASRRSGVMSLNTMPGLGKSGMSRTCSRRSTPTSARDLAQVPDQQQVLEVAGDRGQVLQCLDRLLALVGIARAQRRAEDLLEQRRLAVGRGAEHPQVASAHAVAGQLGHRADDLALGVVVVSGRPPRLAFDHAVLLQLAHELRAGAGVL